MSLIIFITILIRKRNANNIETHLLENDNDGVLSEITVSNNRPKLELCCMFHYRVAMPFVYELVYCKIASKTLMIGAIGKQMAYVVAGCLNYRNRKKRFEKYRWSTLLVVAFIC